MNQEYIELLHDKTIGSNCSLYIPEHSEWQCYLFGMGKSGICFMPLKGKEPNWFWRKMQYLVFGNEWVKKSKSKS